MKMRIVENQIEEDKERSNDVRSMEEILKMAYSICPIQEFTGNCPEANENGKLSILLDINC